jgi:hypothetical protein
MSMLDQYINECRSRLQVKHRLAGVCLFLLITLWSIEFGVAGVYVLNPKFAPFVWLPVAILLASSLLYVYRGFWVTAQPKGAITAAFLDRRLLSGSLIESAYQQLTTGSFNKAVGQKLLSQAQSKLERSEPREHVPIRPPAGFELGLALVFILALFIGASDSNAAHSSPFETASPSQSLLQGDPEIVLASGATPDSEDGIEVDIVAYNTKAAQTSENKGENRPSALTLRDNGSADEAKDPKSEIATTNGNPKPSPKALAGAKAGAGTAAGNTVTANSGNPSKSRNAGESQANADSKGADNFAGVGTGSSKKTEIAGTKGRLAVFDSQGPSSIQNSSSSLGSWRMKEAVKRYFGHLNEEK